MENTRRINQASLGGGKGRLACGIMDVCHGVYLAILCSVLTSRPDRIFLLFSSLIEQLYDISVVRENSRDAAIRNLYRSGLFKISGCERICIWYIHIYCKYLLFYLINMKHTLRSCCVHSTRLPRVHARTHAQPATRAPLCAHMHMHALGFMQGTNDDSDKPKDDIVSSCILN